MTEPAAASPPPAVFPLPAATVTTLGDTVQGDVFYMAGDPSWVWQRCPVHPGDAYCFITPGIDCWYPLEEVGDGDPYQVVVVIHNATRGT